MELILVQRPMVDRQRDCLSTLQCDSVHGKYDELISRGIHVVHKPENVPWGCGAELMDPNRYPVMIRDNDAGSLLWSGRQLV
jgi:hypothetical protein